MGVRNSQTVIPGSICLRNMLRVYCFTKHFEQEEAPRTGSQIIAS
jgi:hypothetical protein